MLALRDSVVKSRNVQIELFIYFLNIILFSICRKSVWLWILRKQHQTILYYFNINTMDEFNVEEIQVMHIIWLYWTCNNLTIINTFYIIKIIK